jgi:hypothetical protein
MNNVRRVVRDEMVCKLYRGGKTLQAVGDRFRISRERVRQILDRSGVGSDSGGQAVRSRLKVMALMLAKANHKGAKMLKHYGCSVSEYMAITLGVKFKIDRSCIPYVYSQMKNNCKRRGLVFRLTLPEWYGVWQASGMYELRGPGHGRYSMARRQHNGPYALGNVKIVPSLYNVRKYWAKHKGMSKAELMA